VQNTTGKAGPARRGAAAAEKGDAKAALNALGAQ
jgi:hypothetical protein